MKRSKLARLMDWYKRHSVGVTFTLGVLGFLILASVALIPHFLPHHLGSVSAVKAELADVLNYPDWSNTETDGKSEIIAKNINQCVSLIKIIGEPVKVIEVEADVSKKACLQKVHEYFPAVVEIIGTSGWEYKRKELKNDLEKTIESASQGKPKVEMEVLQNSYFNGYKHYNKIDYPEIYTYDVERVTCTSYTTDGRKKVKLKLEAL